MKEETTITTAKRRQSTDDKVRRHSRRQRLLAGGLIGFVMLYLIPIIGLIVLVGLAWYWFSRRRSAKP